MTTATDTKPQTFEFQAETRKLLDIVIHSLYTHKEIFLRELISNASDALDRLRFEALTQPELLAKDEKLEIRLECDTEARTLTILDNGIGMSRDEVITNIGTIAKSGTQELMKKIRESKSSEAVAQLIGQFGVGFYSAFMVSDKVTLITRRAGEEKATRWESSGDGTYELSDDHRFSRGTTITLQLKPEDKDNGLDDFTDNFVLRRIVKRYSDFIPYPIILKEQREEPERDAEGKEIPGKTKTIIEDKTLNSMKPIWTRPQSEVSKDEYAEFYKHISHDWTEPFDVLSLKAEGRIEYQALLFIPGNAPHDLYYREQQWGLQLYVRRVLIMDHCKELLPGYLRFIKGVVDSADLPLNISREMVQQDRHIQQMSKWLTRKVIDHLKKLLEDDRDRYLQFWKEFGRVLKEGVSFDNDNKDRLVPLLFFQSSHDEEKLTRLSEYVERMKPEQEEIFYMTGETRSMIDHSPHLEAFKAKGYEVLYLTEPVDELVVQALYEVEGKRLKSVGKGTVELGSKEEKEEAEKELKAKQEEYGDLLTEMQKWLDEHIKEVRLSSRLTTSPVCLVGHDFDMSPHMERLMHRTDTAVGMGRQKRIMELNPQHEILHQMQDRFAKDATDPLLKDYSQLLLGYALLAEGSELPDPVKFNSLVGSLMLEGLRSTGPAPVPVKKPAKKKAEAGSDQETVKAEAKPAKKAAKKTVKKAAKKAAKAAKPAKAEKAGPKKGKQTETQDDDA